MSLAQLRDRNIAPNWRSLNETVINGELNGVSDERKTMDWKYPSMNSVVELWNESPDLSSAVDVIQCFFANHLPKTEFVTDAAKFILESTPQSEKPILIDTVSSIVYPQNQNTYSDDIDINKISKEVIIKEFQNKVSQARHRLHEDPKNSVRILDLARAHMSLGQHERAIREIKDAVSLSPDNRYVTRCAVKGFLHLGEYSEARSVIKRNKNHNEDPWLLSASVAIDLASPTSVKTEIKKIRKILEYDRFSAKTLSELASALATLESREPTTKAKEVRRLIIKSLIDPIDNSLAQALWLRQKDEAFRVIVPHTRANFSYEYSTLQLEKEGKFKEAFLQSYLWMRDQPFSRRAVLMSSNIASLHLKDYSKAIDILEIGLMANPRAEDLLNNAAYMYARVGKLNEAEEKIMRALKVRNLSPTSIMCIMATIGLIEFRRKRIQTGENCYKQAMDYAHKSNRPEYVENAHLNLINERYIAGIITKDELESQLSQMKIRYKQNHLILQEVVLNAGIDIKEMSK